MGGVSGEYFKPRIYLCKLIDFLDQIHITFYGRFFYIFAELFHEIVKILY